MRHAHQHAARTFDLLGGRLCLDFSNTVGGKRLREPVEKLRTWNDLVSWGRQAGALSDDLARRLDAEGQRRPGEAAAALRRAVDLREALFRIFRAAAEGAEPAAEDLELVNSALSRARSHERVIRAGGRYRLAFPEGEAGLDAVLWPVVRSAAELLTSDEVARVRICEATRVDGCGWLFLDETRNGTRRWCSMKDCGNRAKARRHYRRSKAAARREPGASRR